MIGIFRGDDTNWLGNSPVTVDCSAVGYELVGCKVFMVIQGIASTPVTFPASKIAQIVYSSEQTRRMKTGVFFAAIKVLDTEGRERTLTDTLKVNVTECVSEAYNDIQQSNVVVFVDDIPYNSLTGKPSINGVTVVNDKSLDDYDMQKRLRVTVAGTTSNVATAVDTSPNAAHATALVTSKGVADALAAKADTATTYTKTQVDTAIAAEKTRAEAAEAALGTADTQLATSIATEKARAEAAESTLTTNLTAEKTRAEGAEGQLATNLATEKSRAEGVETTLTTNLANEVTRATGVEGGLNTRLTTAEGSITSLNTGKADKATTLAGYGITNAYTKSEVDALVNVPTAVKQTVLIKSVPNELTCSDSSVGTNYGITVTAITRDKTSGLIDAATLKLRELTEYQTVSVPTGTTYADGWVIEWTKLSSEKQYLYFNKTTGRIFLGSATATTYWDGIYTRGYDQVDDVPNADHTNVLITSKGVAEAVAGKADAATTYTKTQVDTAIATEKARAEGAEGTLTTNLAAEVTRAQGAEQTLTTNLTAEVTRATGAEATLTTAVATEKSRAESAEATLTTAVATEKSRAQGAEGTLTTNLAAEVTRATTAEQTNATAIAAEKTRAETAEGSLGTRLTTAESNISTILTGKADKATTLAGYGITDAYTKTETDAKVDGALTHKQNILIKSLPCVMTCADTTVGVNYGMTVTAIAFDPASGVVTSATVKARELTNETTLTFPSGTEYADGWKVTWTLMAGDPKDVYFNKKNGRIYLNTATSAVYWDGLFATAYNTVDATPNTEHTNALITSAAVADAVVGKADASSVYTKTQVDTAIATEKARAEGVEATLTTAISTEKTRAETAEGTLTTNLTAEVTRATTAENTLTTAVATEKSRAEGVEATLTTAITTEKTRAQGAESTLTTNLAAEVTRATNAETTLTTNLATEKARAEAAEGTLTTAVTTEKTRAQEAEATLTTAVSTEKSRAEAAEATLTTDVATEKTRAQGAESTLTTNLAAEVTRATAAEGTLTTNLAAEKTRAEGVEGGLNTRLTAAEGSITTLTSGKADKATTLAGYGITDAYTKTETDAKVDGALTHKQNILIKSMPRVLECSDSTVGVNYGMTVTAVAFDPASGLITEATVEARELTNKTTLSFPSGTTYADGWKTTWTLMAGDPKDVYFNKKTGVIYLNSATSATYWSGLFADAYHTVDATPDTTHDHALITSAAVATAVAGKADASTTYTKTETDAKIAVETTRANAAEGTLTTNLAAEVTRAQGAESTLTTAVSTEKTRAETAEGTLTTNLAAEVTRATGVEAGLNTRLTTAEGNITTAQGNITAIQGKIPTDASTTNQMADKAWVTQAIKDGASMFRGSFAKWADVPTTASGYTGGEPTKNDYIIVREATDYGSTYTGTWMFRYTGTDWTTSGKNGWNPEYRISTQDLTPEQRAALDSGITSTKVAQIATNATNITTLQGSVSTLDSSKAAASAVSNNPWVASTSYAVGTRVLYGTKLYECTTANSDATFNPSHWSEKSLNELKADKATTISGYGITDAYTKSEVDAKVGVASASKQIALIKNLPRVLDCSDTTTGTSYGITVTALTRDTETGFVTAATLSLREPAGTTTASVPTSTTYANGWVIAWELGVGDTKNLYFDKRDAKIYLNTATSETYWSGVFAPAYDRVDDTPNTEHENVLITSKGVATAVAGKADAATTYTKTEVDTAITTEKTRAQGVEATLTSGLAAEITRATAAETANTTAITTEKNRAETAEGTLTTNLAAEKSRAEGVEATLTTAVATEKSRAEAAEATLTTNLSNEVTRAQGAEGTLTTNLSAEVTRAQGAEATLTTAVATEKSRAEAAESTLTSAVATEKSRAEAAEGTLTTNLAAEVTRATTAEQTNATAIATEKTRAEGIEGGLNTRLTTAEGNITTLTSGKADKATTLAGYGITNAYTKTETDDLITVAGNSKQIRLIQNIPFVMTCSSATVSENYGITISELTRDAATGYIASATLKLRELTNVTTAGVPTSTTYADGWIVTWQRMDASTKSLYVNKKTGEMHLESATGETYWYGLFDKRFDVVDSTPNADNTTALITSAAVATGLSAKANAADVYTQQQTDAKIAVETTRATAAEATLTTAVSTEKTRAETAEGTLTTNLAAEITRATGVESGLNTRLTTAEGNITTLNTGKADKATSLAGYGIADAYTKTETNTAIATETTRAQGVENTLSQSIGTEKGRAEAVESALDTRLDVVEPKVTALETSVTAISGKIPTAATSENKLTDKAYVDSAIQTATATFRGSFATWAAVPDAASGYTLGTPKKNDYIVVLEANDYSSEHTGTWRFKYPGDWTTYGKNGWSPEYRVSESPLTPAQMAAINSGVTSTTVAQVATNATNIATNSSAITALGTSKVNGDAITANAWAASTAYHVGDRVTYAGSFYECANEHTSGTEFADYYWTKKNLEGVKADKATTLSGYGVTDAYTKTEVESLISNVQGKKQNVLVQGVPFAYSCSKQNVAALYTVTLTSITRNDAGLLTAATFTLKEGDYVQTFTIPSGTTYADGWIVPWTNTAELTRNLYFNKGTYNIYADTATSDTYWYGFFDKAYQMVDDAPNAENATRLVTSKGTADAIAVVDAKAVANAASITTLQSQVASKADVTAVGGTAWASSTSYAVGNRVTYNGKLYQCTNAHTSGAEFSENNWEAKNLDTLKADKATTMAGYGITDAYNKTEVDAKVADSQKRKQNLLLTGFPRELTCSSSSFGQSTKIRVDALTLNAVTGVIETASLTLTSYSLVTTKNFPSTTYANGWKFTWTISTGAVVNMLFNRTTGRIYYCMGEYTEEAANYYWDGIFSGNYGTVDATPTSGHTTALITSAGAYTALDLKADKATTYTKTETGTLIAAEKTRAESAEGTLTTAVATINGKIPTAASSQNQLADKSYVSGLVSAVNDKISSSATASNKALSTSEINTAISAATSPITAKMSSLATANNKLQSKSEVESLISASVNPVNAKISTLASSSNPALSDSEVDALIAADTDPIKAKIPTAATATNQLTDKSYVDTAIAESVSIYRGTFANWTNVPTAASSYTGGTPTKNDYIIISDASDYTGTPGTTYSGSWRFKYSGVWSTDGKNGWGPECKWASTEVTVNEVEPDEDGNIQIDGSDINVDDDATVPETIKAAIARLEAGQVEGGGKFKGEFESYAAIPTDATQYEGGTAPNALDYITVEDLSNYTAQGDTEVITVESYNLVGRKLAVAVQYYDTTGTVKTIPADTVLTVAQNTILIDANVATVTCYRTYPGKWALFYTGDWTTAGKSGWKIKYQVNADRELALKISDNMRNIAKVTAQANKTVIAVTGIQGMIPPQASSVNHLADKNWVSDMIGSGAGGSLSGGRFLGEFATVEDIPTQSTGYENEVAPGNNDYIVITDPSGYYSLADNETITLNKTVVVGRRLAIQVTAGSNVYPAGTVITQGMADAMFAAQVTEVTVCVQYIGKWVMVYKGQWAVESVTGWKFKYQMNDDSEQGLMIVKNITALASLSELTAKNIRSILKHDEDIAVLREAISSGGGTGSGIWNFSTLKTYAVGTFVVYNGAWYICESAVTTPGAWTGSANWRAQDISQFIKALDISTSANTTDLTNLKKDGVLNALSQDSHPSAVYPSGTSSDLNGHFYGFQIEGSAYPTLNEKSISYIRVYNSSEVGASGLNAGVYITIGKLTQGTDKTQRENYSFVGCYGPVNCPRYDGTESTLYSEYLIDPFVMNTNDTYIVLFSLTRFTNLVGQLFYRPVRMGNGQGTRGVTNLYYGVISYHESYSSVAMLGSDIKVATKADVNSGMNEVKALINTPSFNLTANLEDGMLTLGLARVVSLSSSSASPDYSGNILDPDNPPAA